MGDVRGEDTALRAVLDEYLGMEPAEPALPMELTPAVREITAALERASARRVPFTLVTGPAGTGKTLACRAFCSARGMHYIKTYPKFNDMEMIMAVHERLGGGSVPGWGATVSAAQTLLDRRYAMFVVDEAQNLTDSGLEMAKNLASSDAPSPATFVLVLSDEFLPGIQRRKDIMSRAWWVARARALEHRDMQQLQLLEGFTPDVKDKVFELTGGVMRDIVRLVDLVDEFMQQSAAQVRDRSQLEAWHVERAGGMLLMGAGL